MNDIDSIIKQIEDIEWNGAYWYSKDEFIKLIKELDDSGKIASLEHELECSQKDWQQLDDSNDELNRDISNLEEKIEELEESIKELNDKE